MSLHPGDLERHGPCGRFAPSPTGPLHLGSLLTAVGSYLSARSRNGRWLLRIEDLDRSRVIPGIADQMLRILESFGFEWDGIVEFQSHRTDLYDAVLARLAAAGQCFACRCSRSQIATLPVEPGDEPVYPGTCRYDPAASTVPHAIRFRIADGAAAVGFDDAIQGLIRQDCRREAGDFVIRRRDGFFAYQLAVVVDDELQGITEVVRGCDLLTSTPRQMLLQRALGYRALQYAHLPLLAEADGRKLAKSGHAVPLDAGRAAATLREALDLLRQEPPGELGGATVAELWNWALANWRPARLTGCRELRLPGPG